MCESHDRGGAIFRLEENSRPGGGSKYVVGTPFPAGVTALGTYVPSSSHSTRPLVGGPFFIIL